jgi:hypothetical protein
VNLINNLTKDLNRGGKLNLIDRRYRGRRRRSRRGFTGIRVIGNLVVNSIGLI